MEYFLMIMSICAVVITILYGLDVLDKIEKRKDESGKEK